jgi:hypothetical protein
MQMQLMRRAKVYYKLVEQVQQTWQDYAEKVFPRPIPAEGWSDFYDCPTYTVPWAFYRSALGGTPIPNSFKCTQFQVPTGPLVIGETVEIPSVRDTVIFGPHQPSDPTTRMRYDVVYRYPSAKRPIRFKVGGRPFIIPVEWTIPQVQLRDAGYEQPFDPAIKRAPPFADPAPTLTIGPPRFPAEPAIHYRGPPGPRVREKKDEISMPRFIRLLKDMVNFVTEGNDAVNAIWKAIPRHLRTKGKPTPQQKALDIYNNIGDLDVRQAIGNLALQNAQDKFLGKLSIKGKFYKNSPYFPNRPVGFETGPAL